MNVNRIVCALQHVTKSLAWSLVLFRSGKQICSFGLSFQIVHNKGQGINSSEDFSFASDVDLWNVLYFNLTWNSYLWVSPKCHTCSVCTTPQRVLTLSSLQTFTVQKSGRVHLHPHENLFSRNEIFLIKGMRLNDFILCAW